MDLTSVPSIPLPPQPPTEFHLFPALPIELRLSIWALTIEPRIVVVSAFNTLIPNVNTTDDDNDSDYDPLANGFYSHTPFPIALHVHKESREDARKSYHLAFSVSRELNINLSPAPARVWFNFTTDTLLLNHANEQANTAALLGRFPSRDLERLRSVARMDRLDHSYGWEEVVAQFRAVMPQLQQLTFIDVGCDLEKMVETLFRVQGTFTFVPPSSALRSMFSGKNWHMTPDSNGIIDPWEPVVDPDEPYATRLPTIRLMCARFPEMQPMDQLKYSYPVAAWSWKFWWLKEGVHDNIHAREHLNWFRTHVNVSPEVAFRKWKRPGTVVPGNMGIADADDIDIADGEIVLADGEADLTAALMQALIISDTDTDTTVFGDMTVDPQQREEG